MSGGAGGNVTTPDFAQNDEFASDYIKNRTHWIEESFIEAVPEMEINNGYVDLMGASLFNTLSPNCMCKITIDDVVYLLMYTYFPSAYEINQYPDFNKDGVINTDDAIYLLMHIYFPNQYPL